MSKTYGFPTFKIVQRVRLNDILSWGLSLHSIDQHLSINFIQYLAHANSFGDQLAAVDPSLTSTFCYKNEFNLRQCNFSLSEFFTQTLFVPDTLFFLLLPTTQHIH